MSTHEHKTMTTAEIRESFLSFFEGKGCKRVASSSLIPDDPSLLLTNAGMNQFKHYYLGTKTMEEIGACSCQKCLRTNDIDNIGDATHLSCFEMLGNFSFGGYSKADACTWAKEFCCDEKYLGLPLEKLYFTVFTDDDEAVELWESLGVDPTHISRLGEDDNFWAAGPTGPCGPCSEIYYDQGEEFGCGSPDCAPGCDCDRYLEFWNLVFTQYDRQEDGSLPELPHQNIDTGMGLERISAIMQYQHTNYEGDILRSLIKVGEGLSKKSYGDDEHADRSLRIVADHSRAVTFMIADGILPSNEGRGYVLRRLLRRAVFHGRMLGIEGAFLVDYAREVKTLLGEVYPELVDNATLVESIIQAEEERFSATLDTGESYLRAALDKLGENEELNGADAFKLHDTYGFPIDLTIEISEAAGHSVDREGFERSMEEQRARARAQVKDNAWSTATDVWASLSGQLKASEFVGYDRYELDGAEIVAIVHHGELVAEAAEGDELELVLDRTPFYAEKGGQVGDHGIIRAAGFEFEVKDCQHKDGELVSHSGVVTSGELHQGEQVSCQVDGARRELIKRNHTATHLLDAALMDVLGSHVSQAGSLVAPDRLRFDFTHFEAVTAEQVRELEAMVNEQIMAAKPIVTQEMAIEDAKASGAVALFGEKYGDWVRVVSVGEEDKPFSRELCGGTHVKNSAEIGLFKIVSEGSVGSGTRRIEALTSQGAVEWLNNRSEMLEESARELKCRPNELPHRVAGMIKERRELEQRLKSLLAGGSAGGVASALDNVLELDGYNCVVARVDGLEAAELRELWDGVRDKADGPIACLLSSVTPEGKVALIAAATDAAVKAGFHAGNLVKAVAEKLGGRGGGRPNMAQAGAADASSLDEALAEARELLATVTN